MSTSMFYDFITADDISVTTHNHRLRISMKTEKGRLSFDKLYLSYINTFCEGYQDSDAVKLFNDWLIADVAQHINDKTFQVYITVTKSDRLVNAEVYLANLLNNIDRESPFRAPTEVLGTLMKYRNSRKEIIKLNSNGQVYGSTFIHALPAMIGRMAIRTKGLNEKEEKDIVSFVNILRAHTFMLDNCQCVCCSFFNTNSKPNTEAYHDGY